MGETETQTSTVIIKKCAESNDGGMWEQLREEEEKE